MEPVAIRAEIDLEKNRFEAALGALWRPTARMDERGRYPAR
jgi:hypothetical protein